MIAKLSTSLIVPTRLALVMWGVFFFELSFSVDLSFLGIYPRDVFGLVGVVLSPLLHGNFSHIVSNTIPFLLLGVVLFFFYPKIAERVFFYCYFLTGLLVWLLGSSNLHIGASGVIYGLAFFLIFYGFFHHDFKSLLISILITLLYGGLFYGLVPVSPGISYESHIFGALTGLLMAIVYGRGGKLYRRKG